MLSRPLRKSPSPRSAAQHHGSITLRNYKFYSKMRVQDDLGDIFEFDMCEDKESMPVVYYDDDETGDKIL